MSEGKLKGRKLWKHKARKVVKKHYVLLVVLCLVAVFYGAEFRYVQGQTQDAYNLISGQDPDDIGITLRINDKSILEIAEEKLGFNISDLRAKKNHQMELAEKTQSSVNDKLTNIRGGMAAVYLLVPLIDSTLSHFNPKALAAVSIVLVVIFVSDWIYSGKKPNVGEGITDYDAYQNTSAVIEYVVPDEPETRLPA